MNNDKCAQHSNDTMANPKLINAARQRRRRCCKSTQFGMPSFVIACIVIIIASALPAPNVAQPNGGISGSQSTSTTSATSFCPAQDLITPCRCYRRGSDIQVWCSHSDLPRVMAGLRALAKTVRTPIDELILENNQLPSLPARFFAPLKIYRLMLRHNGIERLSNGWLSDLGDQLMEVYVVERGLRTIPADSLLHLHHLEAVTIESEHLKRVPRFGRMPRLKYVRVASASLIELLPGAFRDLQALETVSVSGSRHLNRLEAGVFENLPRLAMLNLKQNGINYVHAKALYRLPVLRALDLSENEISDSRMIGRAIRQLNRLEAVTLSGNHITALAAESFIELPALQEIQLQRNAIAEIQYGAFVQTPRLRVLNLAENFVQRIHPEAFAQYAGDRLEYVHLQSNEIGRTDELRSLLDSLPRLRFLDVSRNLLEVIAFGAVRNHEALEQLSLDNNRIRLIERDAFVVLPGLRELRLKNNSLSNALDFPIWNLPGLKGLDLSSNRFTRADPLLLVGLPSLRHLDLSDNQITTINAATFDGTPYLETINVSHNKIASVHQSTFHKLDRLFELDASHNELREFVPGLPRIVERISLRANRIANLPLASGKVMNLPNLKILNLDGNELYRIPRMSLQHLGKLRVLGLAENRLQTVDELSLAGLKELEELQLQDNKLMALHEKSMDSLRVLRVLNLRGNRLELLVDRLLGNAEQLRHLDVSQNNIVEMTPRVFEGARLLEYIDLSQNNLKELPPSLTGMTELRMLDISNNQLANISVDMFSSFAKLEELRVSNNRVRVLTRGSLRGLPHLEYLDLSSNELAVIEPNAIRNLPLLKELVLADNLLEELGDRVCEDLPNLQAVHLQHNKLRHISPTTFYRSPSIVYLNVSANQFDSLQNIGINGIRNVEVLDVSGNAIRRLSTSDLHGLDWLVELKLDDNRICRVQGEPFATMPRLRVLTMRNNRIGSIVEQSFRSVRSNLGIFDLDGNPLRCSCETLWLRAWYQETNSLTRYPGPRCQDGSMLRDMRVTQADCQQQLRATTAAAANSIGQLTNEHGDSYGQFLHHPDGSHSECGGPEPPADGPGGVLGELAEEITAANGLLSPGLGDGKYFTDRYVDYVTNNETSLSGGKSPAETALSPLLTLNNTLLNYNRHKLEQQYLQQQQSPNGQTGPKFTFFGMPLPNLNMGNVWNFGRDAKTRSTSGTRGTPRLQHYRPDEVDFYTFLNRQQQQLERNQQKHNQQRQSEEASNTDDPNERAKILHQSSGSSNHPQTAPPALHPRHPYPFDLPPASHQEAVDATDDQQQAYRPPFRTSSTFSGPIDIEQGGFRPILPGEGNFRPLLVNDDGGDGGEASEDDTLAPANSDRVKIVRSKNGLTDAATATTKSTTTKTTTVPPMTTTKPERIPLPVRDNSQPIHVDRQPALSTIGSGRLEILPGEDERPNESTNVQQFATRTTTTTTTSTTTTSTTTTAQPMTSSTNQRPSMDRNNRVTITTYSPPTTTTTSTPPPIRPTSTTIDPWSNFDQTPSSLATLVAPGADVNQSYRPPPRRSTIVRVTTSPPSLSTTPLASTPQTPNAAELHLSTPARPQFAHTSTATAPIPSPTPSKHHSTAALLNTSEGGRKADMAWYYENYNRPNAGGGTPAKSGAEQIFRRANVGWLVPIWMAGVCSYLVMLRV